ncbi:cytochrome B [Trinickia dabaoshanensis]|uniref:Cytochrome B n=1 Tax=Trinickia dabaoshanensis TaxID=564714 RepID=A0A2N7VTA5_9BURK|nr:cytochrome b/b6 domain-containing protein [Trinickia dabaoshanensis]PMS20362.1 cytochrome B [Trinickia dabaoshanensis]
MSGPVAVSKYDPFARLLHWLVVLLLVAQYVVAWTMPGIHRGTRPEGLIVVHLDLGVFIIAIMIVRVLWRIVRKEPDVVEGTAFTRGIAYLTHGLLYLLLIVQPLMGWANASSRGWQVTLAGVDMPALAPKGSAIGHTLGDAHQLFAWVMLVLIGMHVAAALYHHFVLRDRVLRRMA